MGGSQGRRHADGNSSRYCTPLNSGGGRAALAVRQHHQIALPVRKGPIRALVGELESHGDPGNGQIPSVCHTDGDVLSLIAAGSLRSVSAGNNL